MIYITYNRGEFTGSFTVKNVWDIKHTNPEELYLYFLQNKANEIGVIINPEWLNIMSHKTYHIHLSKEDYKIKQKQWKKALKKYTMDRFIEEYLAGTKLPFKNIYR